jgi:hypothetical protein
VMLAGVAIVIVIVGAALIKNYPGRGASAPGRAPLGPRSSTPPTAPSPVPAANADANPPAKLQPAAPDASASKPPATPAVPIAAPQESAASGPALTSPSFGDPAKAAPPPPADAPADLSIERLPSTSDINFGAGSPAGGAESHRAARLGPPTTLLGRPL